MKQALASAVLALASVAAGAQTLSIDSADTVYFAGFNASGFVPGSFSSGLFGTVVLSGPAQITYEYLGSESGYDTSLFADFLAGSGGVTEAGGSSASGWVDGGVLDFAFLDNHGGEVHNSAGAGWTSWSHPNPSFVILGRRTARSGVTSYLLGFNDSYRGDADFDDLVVRVSIAPIPEPGTYALMLAGLGIVGFIARRRRPV